MNSKLAIPTDNIYKFEAIFGLALLITSLLALNFSLGNHVDKLFDASIQMESIKEAAKRMNLESAYVDTLTAALLLSVTGSFLGCLVGVICSIYGFHNWKTIVQSVDDEVKKLEKEKLDIEIKILKEELRIIAKKDL